MTTTSTLPPPLSAPPTVATLQGLLHGLQQPMHRGIPTPPPGGVFDEATGPTAPPRRPTSDGGAVLDLTHLERLAASPQPVEDPSRDVPRAAVAAPAPATVSLTWSAGRVGHPRRTAALAVVAAAAGTVAALVAAGELALP